MTSRVKLVFLLLFLLLISSQMGSIYYVYLFGRPFSSLIFFQQIVARATH